MLVLSHGKGSQVYLDTLDGRLTLKVVQLSHGRVRVSYDVPDSVRVTRDNAKVKEPKEGK